jgi:hypothetical protein
MFFKGSRFEHVPTAVIAGPDGRTVRYKKTRFIGPVPARRNHTISQGERLDLIAHRYFRDPERFWRICDANLALWPDDLVARAGRRILIPDEVE